MVLRSKVVVTDGDESVSFRSRNSRFLCCAAPCPFSRNQKITTTYQRNTRCAPRDNRRSQNRHKVILNSLILSLFNHVLIAQPPQSSVSSLNHYSNHLSDRDALDVKFSVPRFFPTSRADLIPISVKTVL